MKKRFLTLAMALCLCISLLPMTALAVDSGGYSGKTVIIYTSNVRGNIDQYLQISAAKEAYKSAGADVILVDSGNFLQGTKYSAYRNGKNIIPLLDAVGYDAVAIGTHEFDFHDGSIGASAHASEGENVYMRCDSIGTMLKKASYVKAVSNMSGSNAVFPSGSYSADIVVQHPGGLKVGIYGITNPSTGVMINENYVSGISFSFAADAPAEIADSDIIVCLSNTGISAGVTGNKIVIDAGNDTGFVSGVYVIDNATKEIKNEPILIGNAPDAGVQAAISSAKSEADTAFGSRVASSSVVMQGSNAVNRAGETNTGDLITDALLWYAQSGRLQNKIDDPYYTSSVLASSNGGILVDDDHIVALWNGGNIRGYMYPGEVTITDLRRILPYPNTVSIVYMTGAQLLEQLEACSEGLPFSDSTYSKCASFMQAAGIDYTVNTAAAIDGTGTKYGSGAFGGTGYEMINSVQRVTINSVNGKAFNPTALYAVITHDKNVENGMDASYLMYAIRHGADSVKGYKGQIDSTQTDKTVITSYDCYNVVMDYIKEQLNGNIGNTYAAADSRIHFTSVPTSPTTPTPPTNPTTPSTPTAPTNPTNPNKGTEVSYSDVSKDAWYYDYVVKAGNLGLMSGTSDCVFSPDLLTSRAMLVTILYRMAGSPKVTSAANFTDLTQDWYKNAVAWANEKGIVNGTSNDRFEPDGTLTREQMVVMFYRYAKAMGNDVSASSEITGFADSTIVSSYAENAIKWAVSIGLISGTSSSTLSPQDGATRAQLAKIAVSFLSNNKKA
ncbi:MAG: hypothetical protein GX488_09485 [Clostridiales bacterium]|nr:hypothetical protein [Clostridiales bacterium]